MPKVKWSSDMGSGDIDNYEDEGFESYDGLKPKSGMFKFDITGIKKGESQAGNPKLTVYMKLVGRNKDDKRYDGCPCTDFIPVMKSTVWRLKPFLDAIGVTGKQLLSSTIVDEDGMVQKIGQTKIKGLSVIAQVKLDDNEEYLNVKRYMRPKVEPVDDVYDQDDDADDADDDGSDEPF